MVFAERFARSVVSCQSFVLLRIAVACVAVRMLNLSSQGLRKLKCAVLLVAQ